MLLESAGQVAARLDVFGVIASGGTADMTYGTALIVAAAYAGAALAAAVIVSRRDITA